MRLASAVRRRPSTSRSSRWSRCCSPSAPGVAAAGAPGVVNAVVGQLAPRAVPRRRRRLPDRAAPAVHRREHAQGAARRGQPRHRPARRRSRRPARAAARTGRSRLTLVRPRRRRRRGRRRRQVDARRSVGARSASTARRACGVRGVLGHGEVLYARDERAADALLAARLPRRRGATRSSPRAACARSGACSAARRRGPAASCDGRRRARSSAPVEDRRSAAASRSPWAPAPRRTGLASLAIGGGAGVLDGQAVLGLTLDRHGAPRRADAVGDRQGHARGDAAQGDRRRRGAGRRPANADEHRRAALGARRARRPARSGGRRRVAGLSPRAARARRRSAALGEALRGHATVDVRTYRAGQLDARDRRLGWRSGQVRRRSTSMRSTARGCSAAARRPPSGLWEARDGLPRGV